MTPLLRVIILLTCYNIVFSQAIQDYCSSESFQPRCPAGDAILMRSALYGRMRIGRCITKKEVETLRPGFEEIGCSVDILDFMQRKCSLKAECSIRIIDITTETTRPCLTEFLSLYLEAKYDCIKSKKAPSVLILQEIGSM